MANRRPGRQAEPGAAERTGATRSLDASWPWDCLRCGATVYHDVQCCRECRAVVSRAPDGRRGRSAGPFRSWMRRQSYPRFLGTVTGIAGAEVALTALWLQVLLVGPANLPPLWAF